VARVYSNAKITELPTNLGPPDQPLLLCQSIPVCAGNPKMLGPDVENVKSTIVLPEILWEIGDSFVPPPRPAEARQTWKEPAVEYDGIHNTHWKRHRGLMVDLGLSTPGKKVGFWNLI